MRSCCAALLAVLALLAARLPPAPAQAPPTPPPAGGGRTETALPDLGPPAALPDGAPPQLSWIERQGLRAHACWLADDARHGRYTGSKYQQETARYVAEQFRQLGLEPLGDKHGFLQTYPLHELAVDPSTSLAFCGERITADFAVLPASDTEKVDLGARFAYCGKGRPDEIPGSLKGRIPVVVLDGQPRGSGAGGDFQAVGRYFDLARTLAKSGAVAGVVVLPGDPGALGNALNYQALLPDHPRLQFGGGGGRQNAAIPLFVVGEPGAGRLLAHLRVRDGGKADDKAAGRLRILLAADDKARATNVVAVLPGQGRRSEAVLFSAHHDHIGTRVDGDPFNGADDNASGTAGLLEIAQAFAKAPQRPARSVVFLSVSGEELGLWGSRWFSEHPTWPVDRIVADINIDMIGRAVAAGDTTQIQVTPSKDHDAYSTLVRAAVPLAAALHVSFTSGDRYYERSDHFNFAQKGIPVLFLCDGEHPDYHQVTDHADKLDYARMEQIARLLGWTGWVVAEQKERPRALGKQAEW